MARKIIVLRRTRFSPQIEYEVAFWLDTPSGRQTFLANASATSRVKGATTPEIDAIKAGAIKEFIVSINVPPGSNLVTMQGILAGMHTQFQTDWTNDVVFDRYGSFWDGTTWSMVSNP